jgi:hypothetical protein
MDAVQHPPDALATVHHAEELFRYNLAKSKKCLRELRENYEPCRHNRLVRKLCSCRQKEQRIKTAVDQVTIYQQALDCLAQGHYQPAIDAFHHEGWGLKEPPEERQRLENRKPVEKHRINTVPPFHQRMIILEGKLKELERIGK